MKKYLSNDIITLRAIEPEDIELLYAWENDPEIWEVSHTLVPYSKYILALYIKNSDKDIYESKQLRLMIDTSDGKTIGAIDLFDFEPYHSRVGIGLLIHNRENRSKGYATAALELLITYCFNKLNIHQLYVNIETENKVSIHLFEKHGFSICGNKKEWLRTDSGWKDELILQLIRQ
ncbi:MAG: GNAT family N-acetyltransferase [Bacteroidia bacterium]|nr:GNAT family N-acetyltransferase [Bacteroidia bacterium]